MTKRIVLLCGLLSGMSIQAQEPLTLKETGPTTVYLNTGEKRELITNLGGSSGLIIWNNRGWTHNDHTDTKLYDFPLDSNNTTDFQQATQSVNVPGLTFPDEISDREDLEQDDAYLYLGDIGDNACGCRQNRKVWRISKSSLKQSKPVAEAIQFKYPDQTDFSEKPGNKTDFDCEAFVSVGDSLYLFTKRWLSAARGITTVTYSLPKMPGKHTATRLDSIRVDTGSAASGMLVTGATYLESGSCRVLALCGYSTGLSNTLVQLFYDFEGTDFFQGKSLLLQVATPGTNSHTLYQTEGIATTDGLRYYLTNEAVSKWSIKIRDPELNVFDLGDATLNNDPEGKIESFRKYMKAGSKLDKPQIDKPDISVEKTGDSLVVKADSRLTEVTLFSQAGSLIMQERPNTLDYQIPMDRVPSPGIYIVKASTAASEYTAKVVWGDLVR